jgi:hypothetical protein
MPQWRITSICHLEQKTGWLTLRIKRRLGCPGNKDAILYYVIGKHRFALTKYCYSLFYMVLLR